MMSQVRPFLDFTPGYILDENEETMEYYRSEGEEPPPWSFGLHLFVVLFCFFSLVDYLKQEKFISL